MIETPLLFGPEAALVGVLTQPDGTALSRVAFVTFNAGVIQRIGPHRLNVKLARKLALAGETSFRFDLSGQGDSRSAIGTEGDFWAQAVRDLRSAMDHLEQNFGIHHFALIGICTGAVSVFAAARSDARVVGVLMFDGHWYRTRWTTPIRYWKRFRNKSWAAVAGAAWRALSGLAGPKPGPPGAQVPLGESTPANPPRAEFVRALHALVDRRVAVYFVYSGTVISYYSYAAQFRDAFGREAFFSGVRCDFRPDLDHTLISTQAQQRMIEAVLAWVPQAHRGCDPAA